MEVERGYGATAGEAIHNYITNVVAKKVILDTVLSNLYSEQYEIVDVDYKGDTI